MVYKDNNIQLFDLSTSAEIKKKYVSGLNEIINNNSFVLGSEVLNFENTFSNFIGNNYSVGLNSGTDSLEIALRVLNIGPGDEVIVPSFSFFATSEVVLKVGAQPIYCDINKKDLTIDTEELQNLITKKTKAIIPVHLFGNSCNMSQLKNMVKNKPIKIIEDVAQAFGSKFKDSYLGTIGDFGCFSFYPTKNLGAWGDGGMITFNLKKYLEDIKSLRNHGTTKTYFHEKIGLNSRLDSTQALILNLKINKFSKNIEIRKRNNHYLSKKLNNEVFNVHSQEDQPMNVFPISVENKDLLKKSKKLLDKNNISYGSYYPHGLYEFPVSNLIQNKNIFENTELIKNNIITLPCHPKVSSAELNKIINILNSV
tara:strand:- start:467 stop:1570 length:1104 start_codon:yes stop_codon:yes gene_type:complete